MRPLAISILTFLLTTVFVGSGVLSAEEAQKPLLMPDKTSIFQRVLTRPDAELWGEPGEGNGEPQPAFSRFYVYQRLEIDGKEWLQVGSSSDGKAEGWIAANEAIPWKQQMALAFTNPSNRERTLLFSDKEALMNVVLAEDPGVMIAPIREAALGKDGDSRVVSVEPENYIDITEQFYLLPILEAEEVASHRGYQRVLKVASVAKRPEQDFIDTDAGDNPILESSALDDSSVAAGSELSLSIPDNADGALGLISGGEAQAPDTEDAGESTFDDSSDDTFAPGVTNVPAWVGRDRTDALSSYSAAVVFVIDSTISMGPYIERTKEAVRRIYERIDQANLLDRVRFGLVAYRSNTQAAPKLEYLTRVFASPTEARGRDEFLRQVEDLRPADVSSPRFDEDTYAGVMAGLDEIDWMKFGGRYLVLMTDAGALDAENPLSKWKVGADQVRIEAEQLGVALLALHLKTPQGKGNHASAEQQYRTLTHNAILGRPMYYPVALGAVDAFGDAVDALAETIVSDVASAGQDDEGIAGVGAPPVAGVDAMALTSGPGQGAEASVTPASPAVSANEGAGNPAPSEQWDGGIDSTAVPAEALASEPPDEKGQRDVADQIRNDALALGHAMQLAYLGRVEGTAAPKVFEAWLCDRDFVNPEIATTEVRVLLTKNELSNLHDVVQAILDAGEEAQDETGTADFFDLLRSSAAHLARDPNEITNPEATKLGELGLLGEYLDDLPYRSDVMNLTSDVWEQWSMSQQEEFLDGLRRKLRHYQIYHDDADRWVSLSASAGPGEDVYPVPLEALP